MPFNARNGLLLISFFCLACSTTESPEPFGAIPSERQLAWHDMQYYGFIHFGLNTFTDKEWGYGDESPNLFNPTQLDCNQWAEVAKKAGMKGLIITAKHHDGFCLWPTETTEHSIKKSPWRDGKGDLIKELKDACDNHGLKLGIYLSPWDRNHDTYGSAEYINIYRKQLKELLNNYGDIFEFWMDGANGGDGYYNGANEIRKIDNTTYYDWKNTHSIVRELQPMAIMFSDGGPDVRWVGNERGYANETNWSTAKSDFFYPGIIGVNDQLQQGHEDGDIWLPTEVNTSIRPGWFYHEDQDSLVKSLNQLVENWFHSVGMNGNFLLNIPPDKRGLIHENDVQRLFELKQYLDTAFSKDVMLDAKVKASNTRGDNPRYAGENVIDADDNTYWSVNDDLETGVITFDFEKPVTINSIELKEHIKLGQRIKSFSISGKTLNSEIELSQGTTIGNRRIVRFESQELTQISINFQSKAPIVISKISAYHIPSLN